MFKSGPNGWTRCPASIVSVKERHVAQQSQKQRLLDVRLAQGVDQDDPGKDQPRHSDDSGDDAADPESRLPKSRSEPGQRDEASRARVHADRGNLVVVERDQPPPPTHGTRGSRRDGARRVVEPEAAQKYDDLALAPQDPQPGPAGDDRNRRRAEPEDREKSEGQLGHGRVSLQSSRIDDRLNEHQCGQGQDDRGDAGHDASQEQQRTENRLCCLAGPSREVSVRVIEHHVDRHRPLQACSPSNPAGPYQSHVSAARSAVVERRCLVVLGAVHRRPSVGAVEIRRIRVVPGVRERFVVGLRVVGRRCPRGSLFARVMEIAARIDGPLPSGQQP